jgi:hypothetical protein
MRKFVLIVLGLLTAGPAFAQNVVNGVDRNSQAYRTAYLNTFKAGTCDVNLYQRKTGSGQATVPLWDSNRVQAQACIDAGANGGRQGNFSRNADGTTSGSP